MSDKEYVKTYLNAAKSVLSSPNGTARLLSGFSTLKNGADAGVTPSQMRAMFPDLRKYSDATIEGFIEMGSDLVEGKTIIPSAVFEDPEPNVAVAQ
ncbi:hypothetical protein [Stenotrophomonas hibiscicola]|uniref:hypothetical protein n=1 Tax=Stenotrophomonas hibiscicola TaxID=86189 RepID=UPI002E76AF2D|nr:hypothetical protein [[Pseudomonas] hibiscicola]